MDAGIWVRTIRLALLGTGWIAAAGFATAQEAGPPEILLAAPFAAARGETTKITLRGRELRDVSAVRASDPRAIVRLGEQGAAPVPGGQAAERIGDTRVEIELELPADFDAATLALVAITDRTESQPYEVLTGGEPPRQAEQEPNNGFSDCPLGRVPLVVDGLIERPLDVDLVAFEAAAGQRLACEVVAERRGSGCDPTLTLYDAKRIPLAYSDDVTGRDPRIEITLPAAGRYYLAVADANDQGGPAHPYRLVVDGAPQQPGR